MDLQKGDNNMAHPTAAELNAIFQTEGAFYSREANGEIYTCRSQARITRKGTVPAQADAVFVLVNPGSCQPENKSYKFPAYSSQYDEIPLVAAKTDPTQHQIMRLMERKKWDLVYIVNLSDLRAGNIDEFKELKKSFESDLNDSHSIFSIGRIRELEELIAEKTIIIRGWGTQPFMRSSMIHAMNILSGFDYNSGLPHKTRPYYYHPFPMVQHKCIKWLDDICEKLEDDVYVR